MLTLWLLAALVPPAPAPSTVRELLGESAAAAVSRYQHWELGYRQGLGHSDGQTSGQLAWGESAFLRDLVTLAELTGDPYWLERFEAHFDRCLASQSDRNGDGYLAWDDRDYSVGLVEVGAVPPGLSVTPASRRESVAAKAAQISGHRYALRWPTSATLQVDDLTTGQPVLGPVPYGATISVDLFAAKVLADDVALRAASGPLTISGPAPAGVRVEVQTTAREWIEYVVHDGMITWPLARYLALVAADPQASAARRAKAELYRAWFERQIHHKWQRAWRDLPDGAGAYTFTAAVTERYPNYLLPHNQYLALARSYLVLADLPGLPQAAAYRAKATAMARYFKAHLQPSPDGQGYLWNYWDPAPGEDVRRSAEDHGHATIDVGFVVEAVRRGVVFEPADALRLAHTYTRVMAGDSQPPRLTFRVDGQGERKQATWDDWLLLGEWSEPALRQAVALGGSNVRCRVQLLEVLHRLGGLTAADRAAALAGSVALQTQLPLIRAGNGGFEAGHESGPFGWTFSRWSEQAGEGRFEWSREAHSGQRSAALLGTAGRPNLVLERVLEVAGPTVGTVTVWYRTSGEPRPSLSLIADRGAQPQQYDNSPALATSEAWRQARWEFRTQPGVRVARLFLRAAGVGTVWFDDLELTLQPAP
ncbi:MAG: hypothetical protein IT204_01875 [Fimbriimonadaceae bacterium]|nr:hypothetical protein [Fimbriimonadaceae bacterium]